MRRILLVVLSFLLSILPVFANDWDDLRAAIYYQRDAEVVELLDSGVDVNMIGPDGWTPLMIAAEQGDVRMVEYLLSRGADKTLKTDYGRTAFDITGSSQVKRLVRVPVEDPLGRNGKPAADEGATPAAGRNDPKLWSDARWNIEYNQMDELERVLDQEGLDVNATDAGGWTLLMAAAWKDKPDFVRFLLERGANPSLRNDKGETAGDLTTSDEVRQLVGGVSAPVDPTPPGVDLQYCKKLGGQAYLLCDSDDLSCRIAALNDQQQCEQTGVWP